MFCMFSAGREWRRYRCHHRQRSVEDLHFHGRFWFPPCAPAPAPGQAAAWRNHHADQRRPPSAKRSPALQHRQPRPIAEQLQIQALELMQILCARRRIGIGAKSRNDAGSIREPQGVCWLRRYRAARAKVHRRGLESLFLLRRGPQREFPRVAAARRGDMQKLGGSLVGRRIDHGAQIARRAFGQRNAGSAAALIDPPLAGK